jgi:hypothetical protein
MHQVYFSVDIIDYWELIQILSKTKLSIGVEPAVHSQQASLLIFIVLQGIRNDFLEVCATVPKIVLTNWIGKISSNPI